MSKLVAYILVALFVAIWVGSTGPSWQLGAVIVGICGISVYWILKQLVKLVKRTP